MSGWKTLYDGRKIFIGNPYADEEISSKSREFRNPEKLTKFDSSFDKKGRLFQTLCFWCRAPVFFVENGTNGGCFLADTTPNEGGWKRHHCWDIKGDGERRIAINFYHKKISVEKKTSRTTSKKKDSPEKIQTVKKIRKLDLFRCPRKGTKVFVVKLDKIDTRKIVRINGDIYQIVQFKYREKSIRALILSSEFPNGLLAGKYCTITLMVLQFYKQKIPLISSVSTECEGKNYRIDTICSLDINDVSF